MESRYWAVGGRELFWMSSDIMGELEEILVV